MLNRGAHESNTVYFVMNMCVCVWIAHDLMNRVISKRDTFSHLDSKFRDLRRGRVRVYITSRRSTRRF